MLVIPLLLVLVAEGVVRLFVTFPPTTYFVEQEVGGRRMVTDNPYFGYTFLTPKQARDPAQNLFPADKPPGTTRILVLGESAAMGFPHPEFGLARMLKAVLQNAAPGQAIDMIDASMTMINSHILRELLEEGLCYQPDVVVLYIGNNEIIGPYGPTQVFQHSYPSVVWVRLDRWVRRHSYVVRWLNQTVWSRHASAWQGLDHFRGRPLAAGDARLRQVRENFRRNVRWMLRQARARGIPVYVAATAVNLDDWPPLYSVRPAGLTPEQRAAWEAQVAQARAAMAEQRWADALAVWQQAEQVGPDHAETVYGLARCRDALGETEEASRLYERACELDAYRFRSDRPLYDMVTEEVAALQDPGVRLIDARSALSYRNQRPEPVFLEHVHFTVSGMYELAGLFAEPLLESLWPDAPAWDAESARPRVMAALFMQPDVESDAWGAVRQFLDMEVFRDQPGYVDRVRDAARRRDDASRAADTVTRDALETAYRAATNAPGYDWRIDLLYGQYLARRHAYQEALAPLRRVTGIKTNQASSWLLLGQVLHQVGDYPEAIRALDTAVTINPYYADAWSALGLSWFVRGSRERAREAYEKALALDPHHAATLNNLGYMDYEKGLYEAAILRFRAALEQNPDLVEARYHLGLSLLAINSMDEASACLREVVAVRPELGKAWSAWGVILMKQGKTAEAAQKFARALAEQPELMEARINLSYAHIANGKWDQAQSVLESVLQKRPDDSEPNYLYGIVLDKSKGLSAALPYLKRAMQAAPHRTDWMLEIAQLYLRSPDPRPEWVEEAKNLAERAVYASRGRNPLADKILKDISARSATTNIVPIKSDLWLGSAPDESPVALPEAPPPSNSR